MEPTPPWESREDSKASGPWAADPSIGALPFHSFTVRTSTTAPPFMDAHKKRYTWHTVSRFPSKQSPDFLSLKLIPGADPLRAGVMFNNMQYNNNLITTIIVIVIIKVHNRSYSLKKSIRKLIMYKFSWNYCYFVSPKNIINAHEMTALKFFFCPSLMVQQFSLAQQTSAHDNIHSPPSEAVDPSNNGESERRYTRHPWSIRSSRKMRPSTLPAGREH